MVWNLEVRLPLLGEGLEDGRQDVLREPGAPVPERLVALAEGLGVHLLLPELPLDPLLAPPHDRDPLAALPRPESNARATTRS